MSFAIRARLVAFVILSAIGITYVAANYLGFVDKLLGRGFTVHAELPSSGGLFEGSSVTYRGVKVGKVTKMEVSRDGVRLDLAMEEGTELPVDAAMYVHNLSAVGEQYLDFEPVKAEGPYAKEGTVYEGSAESLPTDEADLLVQLDRFVNSVDKRSLQVMIAETGDMFQDTAGPLQQLLDSGSQFIDEAAAHTDATRELLNTGLTVLSTQQDQGENIKSFARDLALFTDALRDSDRDLRQVLDDTPAAAREINALLKDLEPSLPVLLSDLITVQQTVYQHLPGLEQLLVTYPRVIAGGFTGTPPNGFGRVNLQMSNSQPPCTQGYKATSQWRQANDLTDAPIFPARCTSGAPYVMRGTPNVPGSPTNPSPGRTYSGSYDPATGLVSGAVGANGEAVYVQPAGDLSILGDDSWKWLLVGSVASQ